MYNLVQITCCKCKTLFGMQHDVYEIAKQRGHEFTFYCPHGHKQHFPFGETQEELLRRERDRLKQENARLVSERKIAEAKVEQLERKAKNQARRAKAGTCPCCSRTFKQLAAHMKQKHPEYAAVK